MAVPDSAAGKGCRTASFRSLVDAIPSRAWLKVFSAISEEEGFVRIGFPSSLNSQTWTFSLWADHVEVIHKRMKRTGFAGNSISIALFDSMENCLMVVKELPSLENCNSVSRGPYPGRCWMVTFLIVRFSPRSTCNHSGLFLLGPSFGFSPLLTQNVLPSPSPALPAGYCGWKLLALITGPDFASLRGNA